MENNSQNDDDDDDDWNETNPIGGCARSHTIK